jgi:hypothetical protein
MKKNLLLVAIVIAVVALWLVVRKHIPSGIDYQGQRIRLSKYYSSFEDYKDDPDNIDPSENARVAELVEKAPVQRRLSDRKEVLDAVFKIKFPGYGLGSFPAGRQADGSELEMYTIEIPRAGKTRFLTFRHVNNMYTLVDDFVDGDLGGTEKVRLENGSLVYSLENGTRTLTHPILK